MRLAGFMEARVILVHVGNKTKEKEATINSYLDVFSSIKKRVTILWKSGDPVHAILSSCLETTADLLILGALQRENIVKYYLGSIARKIAKKAPCSLLLLIKPSVDRVPCNHIVVNGLKNPKTKNTIASSFAIGHDIGANKITIIEEVSRSEINITVEDDKSLEKSTFIRKQLEEREEERVSAIITEIGEEYKKDVTVKTQSIFGTRGYSIGHYAKIHRADLLIMNKPEKYSFLDRIFPQDIDYILSELPTDVLIIN
jgi:hypothetical protein